ncbi:MAG: septal ring lytic transglycosylase RlpA family protein [Nitrospirota bacterium]
MCRCGHKPARGVFSREFFWALLLVLPAACATLPHAPAVRETGVASWYGEPFHGRLTASGERYDMHALTAAHRVHPFGARLQVTNLENGRAVIVRVNDRGPFARGRIIDLSFAAATAIGMIGNGTARVRVERMADGEAANGEEPAYTVQVGSFQDEAAAAAVRQRLAARYADVFVTAVTLDGVPHFRVRVGRVATIDAAEALARRLSREGFTPFVTRQDSEAMLR